jgi:hypothetical protein
MARAGLKPSSFELDIDRPPSVRRQKYFFKYLIRENSIVSLLSQSRKITR